MTSRSQQTIIAALLLTIAVTFQESSRAQSRPLDKAAETRREAIPEAPPGEITEEEEPADAESEADPKDYTPFGVDLAAIHLLSHQDQADLEPEVKGDPVMIDPGVPAPEPLADLLAGYIGKPASMGLLSDLAKDIVTSWRDSDYPIVDVYFPEQNITKGKIQIVIREAVLGEVRVEGAKHSNPDYLRRQLRLDPGDRINQTIVVEDLDWLNVNPIRSVNLIYEKGEEDGTSDIVLLTEEENSLTFYTGFANTGLVSTGENEWSFGANLANPFKTEQSLGYNFSANEDFENLNAHSIFYQAQLPWRHVLSFMGAVVTSEIGPDRGLEFGDNLEGESTQASLDYQIPLPDLGSRNRFSHDLVLGVDVKTTNSNLLFGGFDLFTADATVFQFRTDYEASLTDELGQTRVRLTSVIAPGNVLNNNDDAAFENLRFDSTADYWYGQAEIERSLRLPGDFWFRVTGTGQFTNSRLISTEQILGGGYLTVRGFNENVIRGDSGALVRAELISPSLSFLNSLFPKAQDEWNVFGFYDGAYFKINDAAPGIPDPSIQSLGIGLNCRIADHFFGRVAYGWNIGEHGVLLEPDDGKIHFGFTLQR